MPGAEVARLGGDEFTVILPGLSGPEAAASLARHLLESFRTPFALDSHEVVVSASVGIVIYPMDGADSETLLKHADVAMYQAKNKGRNRSSSSRPDEDHGGEAAHAGEPPPEGDRGGTVRDVLSADRRISRPGESPAPKR